MDGTIFPLQHFPFGAAFVCQAFNFWTLLLNYGALVDTKVASHIEVLWEWPLLLSVTFSTPHAWPAIEFGLSRFLFLSKNCRFVKLFTSLYFFHASRMLGNVSPLLPTSSRLDTTLRLEGGNIKSVSHSTHWRTPNSITHVVWLHLTISTIHTSCCCRMLYLTCWPVCVALDNRATHSNAWQKLFPFYHSISFACK